MVDVLFQDEPGGSQGATFSLTDACVKRYEIQAHASGWGQEDASFIVNGDSFDLRAGEKIKFD